MLSSQRSSGLRFLSCFSFWRNRSAWTMSRGKVAAGRRIASRSSGYRATRPTSSSCSPFRCRGGAQPLATTTGPITALRNQRNAIRQLVLDDGADLVLDLEVACDLGRGKDGRQLWHVALPHRHLRLLDRESLVEKTLGRVVGEGGGLIEIGIAPDQLGKARIELAEIC